MEKELKDLINNYCLWGIFLGIITMLIRPFISVKQTIRDMAITFLVSMLSGLLMEYVDIPVSVKFGFSGVCGLFAVRIFIILENLLIQAGENPVKFIKTIREKNDDTTPRH